MRANPKPIAEQTVARPQDHRLFRLYPVEMEEPNSSKDFAPRVLLVDDEPLLLKTLSAVLEAHDFVCRTATDGFQALRLLRETPPDIQEAAFQTNFSGSKIGTDKSASRKKVGVIEPIRSFRSCGQCGASW